MRESKTKWHETWAGAKTGRGGCSGVASFGVSCYGLSQLKLWNVPLRHIVLLSHKRSNVIIGTCGSMPVIERLFPFANQLNGNIRVPLLFVHVCWNSSCTSRPCKVNVQFVIKDEYCINSRHVWLCTLQHHCLQRSPKHRYSKHTDANRCKLIRFPDVAHPTFKSKQQAKRG